MQWLADIIQVATIILGMVGLYMIFCLIAVAYLKLTGKD